MKTTITIEFSGEPAQAVSDLTRGVDLGILLRDALGEFIAAHTPARTSLDATWETTSLSRLFKIREVAKRCALAEVLKRGDITIETEEGDHGHR